MVTIELEIKKDASLEDLQSKAGNIARKGLNYTSQDLLRNLVSNSPVDTGLLKGWFPTRKGDMQIEVKSPAAYVGFVNDGTGLYGPSHQKITPKNGKVLHWVKDGKDYFAKSVKGQKGQKFVEKSIEQTSNKIEQYFLRATQEELG